MTHLNSRLEALENRVQKAFPLHVDDDMISDVVRGRVREPETVLAALDKLFDLIKPALSAALREGLTALMYCEAHGIDRPPPTGPLQLLTTVELWHHSANLPPDIRTRWTELKQQVAQWLAGLEAEKSNPSYEDMRAYLVVKLAGGPTAEEVDYYLRGGSTPTLSETEAHRLLDFVRPLETGIEDDLPLMLWKEPAGSLRTSLGDPSSTWTPVECGLDRARYLFVARSASPTMSSDTFSRSHMWSDNSDTSLLRRLDNRQLAGRLGLPESLFVNGSPHVLDEVFLRIEPYLMAAVLAGAQSLRAARRLGLTQTLPQTAVSQAAHIVSYASTAAMPTKLVELCGWAIPESDNYDCAGIRLAAKQSRGGAVRGALVFRLLEKHGLSRLRTMQLSDDDVPSATDHEAEGLLELIAPLRWEPDPDLPLLAWRRHTGDIRTSSAKSGHIRTISDMEGNDSTSLILPDQAAIELIPQYRIDGTEHYRPIAEGGALPPTREVDVGV